MKKLYTTLEIELVEFDTKDVIITSGAVANDSEGWSDNY